MATNGDTLNSSSSTDSADNNNNSANVVSQPTTTAILDPESLLKVDIREDNGAIDTVLFSGSDFCNPGGPVSDFGLQNGTNTSSFVRNDTSGFTQQPVSVSEDDGSVVVTGTYTQGGANVDFKRTYTQIDGFNAFEVETEFTNNGSDVNLRYFDTFDPDQGVDRGSGFSTFNDVLTLDTGAGEAKIGQATESGGLTFILGSLDSDATVASGNPFSISSGSTLNNFFTSPFDGNGALADSGTHIGVELDLDAGESETFNYLQAYGETIDQAQEQFIDALTPPAEIFGTEGNDVLAGTNRRDIIYGLGGNDIIEGLNGNDQIFGGGDNDVISSGSGKDTVEGGTGSDRILGNSGNDILSGNSGQDNILGGEGNDEINGGDDSDRLLGEAGNDTINGDNGNDTVDGGAGNDTINGGNGIDNLFGGDDSDSLSGGVNDDTLEGGFGNDNLDGGEGDDKLIGVDSTTAGSGVGFGAGEVDTLTGGAGGDTFVLADATRVYYSDGDPLTLGDSDYALITDFNVSEDTIQLKGSADLYSLDFFTSSTGTIDALLNYDPGVTARGEAIGILQNASTDLTISSEGFSFV